jgi:hypothetical protein
MNVFAMAARGETRGFVALIGALALTACSTDFVHGVTDGNGGTAGDGTQSSGSLIHQGVGGGMGSTGQAVTVGVGGQGGAEMTSGVSGVGGSEMTSGVSGVGGSQMTTGVGGAGGFEMTSGVSGVGGAGGASMAGVGGGPSCSGAMLPAPVGALMCGGGTAAAGPGMTTCDSFCTDSAGHEYNSQCSGHTCACQYDGATVCMCSLTHPACQMGPQTCCPGPWQP